MTPSKKSNQTRAEQIRSQRQVQDKPKKAYKKLPKMPVNPTNQQRVTKRVTTPSSSPKTRYQPNTNRRKVYVPLKTPGAELGLPALPDIKFGWRIVSILLFISCLFGVIGMKSMDIFRISQVNLVNAQRVPPGRSAPPPEY